MSNAQPTDHDDGRDSSDEDDSRVPRLSISETQDLCNITYSREETIAAFRSYYEFLSTMYLDPAFVQTPPDGGVWPGMTVENMRNFGKTDEVVELLGRLPYIRPVPRQPVDAGAMFELKDWASIAERLPLSDEDAEIILTESQGSYRQIPAHVVGLTHNRDAEMFLDTHLGLIYFPGGSCTLGPTRIAQNADVQFSPIADCADDYAAEGDVEWRDARTGLRCAWAIPDFFEMLKFYFRELNYIPLNRIQVVEAFDRGPDDEEEQEMDAIRTIFLEHGWPDLNRYENDKCMDAIERRMDEFDQRYRV
ncbi:unnamed protein product [Zymoseptoria tritici ST99CH_1E4]|uniref:Uncharacterized protein n=1 Tax=Zymoseptoria tritici ST99CH_1E4 TaxID=1276532 RepID=A0A2H1GXA7_ZYMTR|nr:unnamed protein product [Zymoseptoria tritici ST99CH_1E4]